MMSSSSRASSGRIGLGARRYQAHGSRVSGAKAQIKINASPGLRLANWQALRLRHLNVPEPIAEYAVAERRSDLFKILVRKGAPSRERNY